MDLAGVVSFIATVVVISLSGVLLPGPMTAVTLADGAKNPHAGAWIAVGHGAFELPLMALIYFGAGFLFQIVSVKVGIGVAGGLILLWMGAGMLRDYRKVEVPLADERLEARARSPFISGILLSAGNPLFLIWWATAGAALISYSLKFGLIGFIILATAHWLCDFIWYYLLSAMSFRGNRFFGKKLQQGVFIVCGLALVYFSGYFMAAAVFEIVG